jgi:seryl-tRNA synthetase
MRQRSKTTTGFRLTERQLELLTRAVEESDEWDSKQDFLHTKAIELIDETGVAADDPQAELEQVRERREEMEDQLQSMREDMRSLKSEVEELQKRERELEERVEEVTVTGASSYGEALERLAEHVRSDDVKGITEQAGRVEEVADEWVTTPEQVLQDLFEQRPEVKADDLTLLAGSSSGWERVKGDDYDEAVELVARWIDRRVDEGQAYARRQYPEDVADEHDVDLEELVEDACEEIDVDPERVL